MKSNNRLSTVFSPNFCCHFLPGGVLEAEGTVSIKLRLKDQRKIMERLDNEMKRLIAESKSTELTPEQKEKIETNIMKREEILAPIYHQVKLIETFFYLPNASAHICVHVFHLTLPQMAWLGFSPLIPILQPGI